MIKLTIDDLVRQIAQLGTQQVYGYVSGRTKLQVTNVTLPEGPISFIRWDSTNPNPIGTSGRISRNQLARIAVVCSNKPNFPLHVDRLFSAGGNSRSALETLLAYTPHFYICYPKRIDSYTGEIRTDLKHFIWRPSQAHELGQLVTTDCPDIITELEINLDFGHIGITPAMLGTEFDSIDAKRTHTQIQIALIEIGNALGFRTWIAKNDRHIPVGDNTLGNLPGVIPSLEDVKLFYDQEVKDAAALVDCIWFTQDLKRIPALIEIEHSTRVTSGMTRMNKFKEVAPSLLTKYTVVAPNYLRNKVVTEANQPLFRNLNARYMSYSTVRELFGLIQRYKLKNVVDHTFVYPFMEQIVEE